MKYKDIILVDADEFKKAVAILEEAGIDVSVPVSRKAYWIE